MKSTHPEEKRKTLILLYEAAQSGIKLENFFFFPCIMVFLYNGKKVATTAHKEHHSLITLRDFTYARLIKGAMQDAQCIISFLLYAYYLY